MDLPISQHLELQARACEALGSPFSAGLLQRAASAFAHEPLLQAAFHPWRAHGLKALFADAAALRWLGALHDHVLAEPASALASTYPDVRRPGDSAAAWPHVLALMAERGDEIRAFMRHEPQTNEVRRSVVLMPGFLEIAAAGGPPLRLFELGASAGLNQLWDARRYRLGEAGEWGPTDARLVIDTDWRGAPPALAARPDIASRKACDRRPVRLADPMERQRLAAYVWPDQLDRKARLAAAIEETLAGGLRVARADAPAWTRRHAAPRAGFTTVVFHSVFFQYMSQASRAELTRVIEEFGAAARKQSPFTWLRMEPAADNPAVMELRLTRWPDGEDRRLAITHPHGAWVEWLA